MDFVPLIIKGVPVEMDGQTFDPETAGGRTLPESLEGEGSGLRLSQAVLRFLYLKRSPNHPHYSETRIAWDIYEFRQMN